MTHAKFQELYAGYVQQHGKEIMEYVHENIMEGAYRPGQLQRVMRGYAGKHPSYQAALGVVGRNGYTQQDNVRVLEIAGGQFAVWLPRAPKPPKEINQKIINPQQPAAQADVYVTAGGAQSTPAVTQEHTMKNETKTTKATKNAKASTGEGQVLAQATFVRPNAQAEAKPKAAKPKASKAKVEPKAAPAPKPLRHETIARTGFDGTYTLANGIMPTEVVDAVIEQVLLGKKSASGLRRVARKYVGLFTTASSLEHGAKEAGLNIADKGVILVKVEKGTALFRPLSPKALAGVTDPKPKVAAKDKGKAKAKAVKTEDKDAEKKA